MPGIVQCNLVTGAALISKATIPNPVYNFAGPFGSCISENNEEGNQGYQTTDPPFLSNSGGVNVSIFGVGIAETTNASQGVPMYGERAPGSGSDIIKIDFSSGAGGEFTLRNDASKGALVLQLQSGPTYTDSKPHTWLGTKGPAAASPFVNTFLYADGVLSKSGNWAGPDSFTDTGLVGGVLYDAQDNSACAVSINLTAAWTRTLTPDEALVLAADPYCFLIFPEDELMRSLVGRTPGGMFMIPVPLAVF
jgi:hypothetical protein